MQQVGVTVQKKKRCNFASDSSRDTTSLDQKTPQMCYLRHAEHHAKNRTSLCGLDHDTLFFE